MKVHEGVIDANPPVGGWIAGGETGVVQVELEASGDYSAYLPDEENQSMPGGFESSACVTFSALNDIETLLNRMRAKNLLPTTHEKFLVENGYVNKLTNKVNFSDRFTAKMSGTTEFGNNLGAVGESIRSLHGVLPESDWQMPPFTNDGIPGKFEIYYKEIPQDLQAKARKFLNYFKINYHWILVGTENAELLKETLKNGPVQVATKVCPPWNSNEGMPPIAACGAGAGHGTMLYAFDGGVWKDFDSYRGFRKSLASDYNIPYAVQYYIEAKPLPVESFHWDYRIGLKMGAPAGMEVHKLQEGLQYLKDASGKPYMQVGVFGPYGPATKAAVGHFQADHGIVDPDGAGTNFGPSTRAAMNLLVSQ